MGDGLTADQMFQYFQAGAVGTKEFRSFLAAYDSRFGDIRDPDVDNEIDAEARRRQEMIALQRNEQEAVAINRDGSLQ